MDGFEGREEKGSRDGEDVRETLIWIGLVEDVDEEGMNFF